MGKAAGGRGAAGRTLVLASAAALAVAAAVGPAARASAQSAGAPERHTMPLRFRQQAERRVAEYGPRLATRVRTEDPGLDALLARIYRDCVVGKLFDPMPPELPHRWFAPGGSYYLGQWLWDTMFVVDAFAPLGDDEAVREVFENYWHAIDANPDAPRGHPRHGMVPNFLGARELRANGAGWPPVAYSQIPILGWGVLRAFRQTDDRALVARALPYLVAFDDWYSTERDVDDDGLVEYGAYAAVEGNDIVQTARFETFDFHVPLDGMRLTPHPRRPREGAFYGNVEGVEQTSFLVMTERAMAELARAVGQEPLARRCEARAARRVAAMQAKMWDPQRGFFFSLDRDTDRRIPVRTLQGFLPLAARAATAAQAAALAAELRDPKRWWTRYPVPTTALDEPRFDPKGYWRGDMWPPTTYLVAYGLRQYGFAAEGVELTRRLRALFEEKGISESYDGVTGDPLGVPGLGMSCVLVAMVVENLYGVEDDYRTIRVPEGAAGRRLQLGALAVSYPGEGVVELRSDFAREVRVVFPGRRDRPRVMPAGSRVARAPSGRGEVRFTAAAGVTYRVEARR